MLEVRSGADSSYMDRYRARCRELTEEGAKAQIHYRSRMKMTRGVSSVVKADVTLDESTAPNSVLVGRDDAVDTGVVVSCHAQARLAASATEFDIDDRAWIDRSFFGSDKVEWVWNVVPKRAGDSTLTLFVRPIVTRRPPTESELARARRTTRATSPPSEELPDLAVPEAPADSDASIRNYQTLVHVGLTLDKRSEDIMTRIAGFLGVAKGLVIALTSFITAIAGLIAAVALLKRRGRSQANR